MHCTKEQAVHAPLKLSALESYPSLPGPANLPRSEHHSKSGHSMYRIRQPGPPWTRRSWRLACQEPPHRRPPPHWWPPQPVSLQLQPLPRLLQQLLSAAPPRPTRGAPRAPPACSAGPRRAPPPLVPPPPPRSLGQLSGLRQLYAGQRRRLGSLQGLRAPPPLLHRPRRPHDCWLWVQAQGRRQPCPCPLPPPQPLWLMLTAQQQQPFWQPLPSSSRAGPVMIQVVLSQNGSSDDRDNSRACGSFKMRAGL